MHLDVHDLREFYYRSPPGRAAQKVIRTELMRLWPEAKGQTVVGFGFAVPLLRPFLGDARRVIGLMPGPQGVMPWPAGGKNVSVLCEKQLRSTGLIPTKTLSTLYQPPSAKRGWRRLANAIESAGRYLPVFAAGGVLMVEVTKQVPQPKRPGLADAVKRPLRVLEGMGGPVVKPV